MPQSLAQSHAGTFTSSYKVVLVPVDSSPHPAPFTKQAPFTCAPQEGTLAPGASQKVHMHSQTIHHHACIHLVMDITRMQSLD